MEIFWFCYFFMLGALLSSFMNVVGIRVLDNISIMRNSQCPKCYHKLRFIDILPIFGYLLNFGKCHFCKTTIPIKYLWIEVIGGLLFGINYYINGFTFELVFNAVIISFVIISVITQIEHSQLIKVTNYFFLSTIIVMITMHLDLIKYNYLLGMLLGIILIFVLSLRNVFYRKYILLAAILGLGIGFLLGIFMIFVFLGLNRIKFVKGNNKILVFSFIYLVCLFVSKYIWEIII